MNRFNKHIIVVGSARSGTSWLSETIAKKRRYRLLFEPEHDEKTQFGHLICDRLITETNFTKASELYLKKVFANRVDSDWIAQHSNRKWKRHLWPFIPKKFVIKFVRCNLSASWMHDHFKIPVIHIVRNPYDVVHSQRRVKFPWLYNLDYFKEQPELNRLLKEHLGFTLEDLQQLSDIEVLTIRWCLENVLPMKFQNPSSEGYELVFYEDLRKDPANFLKLCSKFHLEPIVNLKEEYFKPSSKTHPKSVIRGNEQSKARFTKEEISKVNAILKAFKLDFYPILNE